MADLKKIVGMNSQSVNALKQFYCDLNLRSN